MFVDLLIHELRVYRRTGAVDRFGQPVDANPSQAGSLTATYRCRLSGKSGGRVNDERSLDVFEVLHRVFLEPEADVREDDTVSVIDPASGYELMPRAKVWRKGVISDGTGIHHLEVDCKVQRGPQ